MATFVSRVGVVRPTARATSPSRDGLRRLGPRSRIADGISVGCGWKQKRVGGARVGRTRLPADIRATTTDGEDLNEVKKRAASSSSAANKEAEEVAKKWGLEAGLWKVFSSKAEDGAVGGGGNKMDSAKKLLKRYGSAYLVTSISLSIVSISVCYALVGAGVDVAALLDRVGLHVTTTSTQFGTFALAYAAHKALSPVRFPPTVALTPIVAGWLGQEPNEEDDDEV
uniref:DUF1279 domain-containing protein n=1 Tax=Micromonas pusilla TaxID=38833 RepID=A0A7R9TFI8_MICPS